MKALMITRIVSLSQTDTPLAMVDMERPVPPPDQILMKVAACGVCHTELDEIEGRTPPPKLPVIPGHQIVGRVIGMGEMVTKFAIGDRVGVGWISSTCGSCEYCLSGRENLCPDFKATGRDIDGGYAEYGVVSAESAVRIPDYLSDFEAAPLLCAGGVGYRSLRLTGIADGQTLGFSGFGASGHLVLKLAKHLFPRLKTSVFARNEEQRRFALELGADWAGGFGDQPPGPMEAIIDTTPAWRPVLTALLYLKPGGRLVINAIRKENADRDALAELEYDKHLWQEKEINSVANVTRNDLQELMKIAAEMKLRPEVQVYRPEEANQALVDLKRGKTRGAKVIVF